MVELLHHTGLPQQPEKMSEERLCCEYWSKALQARELQNPGFRILEEENRIMRKREGGREEGRKGWGSKRKEGRWVRVGGGMDGGEKEGGMGDR